MEHEPEPTSQREVPRYGAPPSAASTSALRVPEEALEAARRVGSDILTGIVCWESGQRKRALFLPPAPEASADGRAPVRIASNRSLLASVEGQPSPLVVNDLTESRFEEEQELFRDGICSYVAVGVEAPGLGPAAVVFASRAVRRFDAVTIGALLGAVEEWIQGGDASASSEAAPDEPEILPTAGETVVGESEQFLEICRLIAIVARQNTTVLIQGESGTGKEVLAKTIHRYSARAERPFVRVNCAALAETLVESEMFGHRKGAFTGAIYTHKGRFEMADGGTLLLDEIGNLSLAGQAKLLRVLQEREFEPVGQSASVKVDVRIIATTNVDLERTIADGGFREDLYYRLAVVPITVPPLRERRKDILPLAEHFLSRSLVDHGRPPVRIADEAREVLLAYDWPGNARELRNAMEYSVLVARGAEVRAEHLPGHVGAGRAAAGDRHDGTLRERMLRFERQVVLDAFQRAGGVRKDIARILGIDPRNVSYFLRKHGIR